MIYHVLLAYIAGLRGSGVIGVTQLLSGSGDPQPWIVCGTMPLFNPLLLTPHLATTYG